jgi:hypothetical protein
MPLPKVCPLKVLLFFTPGVFPTCGGGRESKWWRVVFSECLAFFSPADDARRQGAESKSIPAVENHHKEIID